MNAAEKAKIVAQLEELAAPAPRQPAGLGHIRKRHGRSATRYLALQKMSEPETLCGAPATFDDLGFGEIRSKSSKRRDAACSACVAELDRIKRL